MVIFHCSEETDWGLHPPKTSMDTQNDALEKVAPFKNGVIVDIDMLDFWCVQLSHFSLFGEGNERSTDPTKRATSHTGWSWQRTGPDRGTEERTWKVSFCLGFLVANQEKDI